MDQLQPIVADLCIAMIILAIILDVAVYKWRKLTTLIFYFEMVYTLLVALIPSTPAAINNWYMMYMFLFIGYFTGSGTQVVVATITIAIDLLPLRYFIYD